MQGGMNLLNGFTRCCFKFLCVLHIEHHLLKHALGIVAVAEKSAINAIEPLLPFRIQNRGQ